MLQLDGTGEGEKPAEGESPPKATKPRRSSSTAKPGRPKGSTKAAKAAAAAANGANGAGEASGADGAGVASSNDLTSDGVNGPAPPPPAPHSDQLTHDAIAVAAAAAAAAAAAGHHPPGTQGQDEDASAMIDPAIAADSQAQAAAAATTVAAISSVAAYQYANSMDPPDFHMGRGAVNPYASAPFPLPVHSAVAALHPQLYQPSSPESNQPRSEHGSPRYGGQTLARHGSNSGSRYMRQSAYDQYATRPASSFTSAADAAIWEGLDTAKLPSPGHVTTPGSAARATANMLASLGFPVTSPLSHLGDRSRAGSHLGSDASYFRSTAPGLSGGVSAGSSSNLAGYASNSATSPAFSFGTASSTESGMTSSNHSTSNATTTTTTQGQEASGATTPKEPVRFSVSTLGPLSPFSNTALNSSMSPYLSAFSNARDTPLVSSPRSALPTTPGGGLASLDLGGQWTGMRPPSRTVSRHNSLQSINISSQSTSPQSDGIAAASKIGKSSSHEKLSLSSDKAESTDGSDSKPSTSTADSTSTASAETSASAPLSAATSSSLVSSTATAPSMTAAVTSGSATTTSAPVQISSSGIDTPSRFVKNESQQYFDGGALTPGPEAFLLRLQGGVQELRAGFHGSEISFLNGPTMALSSAPLDASTFSTPNWDLSMFSNTSAGGVAAAAASAGTPGPQLSALGWLMSPSIQQLLNAMSTTAGSGTVDTTNTSDYFNSKNTAPPDSASLDRASVEVMRSPLERALTDVRNPFYIPPGMFRPAYSVMHWNLPPLTRLSVLALHSQQNLLKHFPIVHEPTFRLDTAPGCIAFTVCMLGGHEAGRKWWAGEEAVPKSTINIINSHGAPVLHDEGLERLTEVTANTYVDEEDGQELVKPIVMSDKTSLLMRAFASRCRNVKDKCAVVQSLMLFESNNFLSSDATTRTVAGVSHGTIVTLARQAGFFDRDAEHVQREVWYTADEVMQQVLFESADTCFGYSYAAPYRTDSKDEDKLWRRWAELEGRRRTAFIIYLMDTIAHLDAAVPTLLATKEVAHLPLPSPDYLWRAPTSPSWNKALGSYKGPTLDEALQQLFSPESGTEVPGDSIDIPSIHGSHGPFARLVMVVALLRGIVEMLEGRATRVAKPSSLRKWMTPGARTNGATSTHDLQVAQYKKALARWRKAWDQDPACRFASVKKPGTQDDMDTSDDAKADRARAGACTVDRPEDLQQTLLTPLTASGATPLSDDALPLYWLAHVLVTHAASNQRLPLRSVEGRTGAAAKNGGYAVVGGGPEMPDFRAMLRFAKNFVTRGEK